jgi:hypothetical protein
MALLFPFSANSGDFESSHGTGLISSLHSEIGLRGSLTKKAIRHALHGAAFSFFLKLERARFASKEKTINFR